MAADNKPGASKGGNTPKPASAKDQSRQQSQDSLLN